MKRGRPSTTGINDAVAIAKKRGCVMRVTYSSDSVCDFFIRTVTHVTFVRLIRIEKIIAPASEIEHKYREIIAELRLFPQSLQIKRELWVYNKYGTYRFFRLTDDGLEESQQSGEPAKNGEPEPDAKPEGGNNKETPATPPS
ncbi:hypothetical protein [Methanoregula sp.]|uniref:hypothetical protein n=1 Tax=Methanoregula sp. TaxID=2052170 RepID=UPI00261033FE|nr:hypothetical protein [Methanoregula sp.]MDD5143048.1 hypothetical protein [Methanoregula sp.]